MADLFNWATTGQIKSQKVQKKWTRWTKKTHKGLQILNNPKRAKQDKIKDQTG